MIRSIILLYLLLCGTVVIAENNYILSGKIENASDTSIAYLFYSKLPNEYVVDSCYIKDSYFSFSGSVGCPVPAILELKDKSLSQKTTPADVINFYLEDAPVSISIDRLKSTVTVTGSRTHDLHTEFIRLLEPIKEEMNSIRAAYGNAAPEQQISPEFNDSLMMRELYVHKMKKELVYRFIGEHPSDFISLYLLQSQMDNTLDDEQDEAVFSSLSDTLKKSALGKNISDRMQKLKAISIGSTAPEFECKDIDGNMVKLSDFRGKYLLLMFWASDCSHCLKELPNVIKASNLLASENFTILSIAVDSSDREKQWRNFVESNRLPWVNLFDERINGKKKIPGLYNVRQTPSNFLLNEDGQIIAKNLYWDLFDKLATEIRNCQEIN